MKKYLPFFLSLALFVFVPSVSAASGDGAGPWADSVVSSSQALRKDGSAVLPARSDPTAAVGVAENDTLDGSFFSLGFGGVITLGFDNGISSGTLIVEATNPGYPAETANVEVSSDGSTWFTAGSVSQDGEVPLPNEVTCAKYVRVTDTSNPSDFSDDTADAYDVDGVQAIGEPCGVPTPTITPTPTDCCCGGVVKQTNTLTVINAVNVKTNTGKNKANNNTGGNTTVTTGNAASTVAITTTGNTNIANTGACCGSTSGNVNVVIKNNGANSKNTVKIKK